MIHVVTGDNQHLYARQLDEMFRMRYDFYVKQRGWSNLTAENGRETDEFDDENAVYLLNLDRHGKILATFRLNPTTGPYLVADKLPHYLNEPAPRREDIWDMGRWMIAPHARRQSKDQIAKVQQTLIVGLMEFAVDRGITGYTCLSDTVFVDRLANVWPVRPMGDVHKFDDAEGEAQLVMIEAGPHILAQTRDRTSIYNSVLFELKPQLPNSNTEKKLREDAMRDTDILDGEKLEKIQTAAAHMITELKAQKSGDIDSTINTIDAFTRYIRSMTGQQLEEA